MSLSSLMQGLNDIAVSLKKNLPFGPTDTSTAPSFLMPTTGASPATPAITASPQAARVPASDASATGAPAQQGSQKKSPQLSDGLKQAGSDLANFFVKTGAAQWNMTDSTQTVPDRMMSPSESVASSKLTERLKSSSPLTPLSAQDIKSTEASVYGAIPFTAGAHAFIDQAKIGFLPEGTHASTLQNNLTPEGTMTPQGTNFNNFIKKIISPISNSASDFIINHTKFFQQLDKANIDISTTDPTVLAHEMFHQLFEHSPMGEKNADLSKNTNAENFGNRFLDTWDKIAQQNQDAPLQQIDNHINSDYKTKDMAGSELATERFAYLGELVVKYGVDVIPKELRPFYAGILDFNKKSTPTPLGQNAQPNLSFKNGSIDFSNSQSTQAFPDAGTAQIQGVTPVGLLQKLYDNGIQVEKNSIRDSFVKSHGHQPTSTELASAVDQYHAIVGMSLGFQGEAENILNDLPKLANKVAKLTNPEEIAGVLRKVGVFIKEEIPALSEKLASIMNPKAAQQVLTEALPTSASAAAAIGGDVYNVMDGLKALTPTDFAVGGKANLDAIAEHDTLLAKIDKGETLTPEEVQRGRELLKLAETKKTMASAPKERGFITSVKEQFPNNTDTVAGQYIPRPTDPLAIRAQNLVMDDIKTAEQIAMSGSDDTAVAVASQLIKHYGEQAAGAADAATKAMFEEKMANVANTIAPKLTDAGRTVQAASILGQLTSAGTVRFAAGEIAKYNDMVRASKGQSLSFMKEIPELSGKQASKLFEAAKEIEATTDPAEKLLKTQKLRDEIGNLIPTPLWEKVVSVWKAGLLTGIKTTGVNIFSNVVHAGMETVKDVPAMVVDSVASLFTKERTLTLNVKGEGGGIMEGMKKGWQYFKTGVSERDISSKFDLVKKVNFGDSAVARGIQTYEETIFKMLGAEDQPFYYGAKARSLYDQAGAQAKNLGLKGADATEFVGNLVQNPTDEMLKYAAIDAETAVFQNKTMLGDVGSAIQRKGKLVGNIVVPFARTPASIMTQVVNYSPVGIVKTLAENIGKGRFDQRLFAQGMGRGIVGTSIVWLGTELIKNNLMTLDYPTGEREQELWKLEGKQPNSIKIDGKWRSVNVLGPGGTLLAIGAHFQDALNSTGSVTGAIVQGAAGGLKSFVGNTFLQGVNQFTEVLNDPGRYADAYFGNLLGSVVPTLVKDVGGAMDTTQRNARSVLERVQARIPYLREKLQPQITTLGNELQRGGNFWETMADPSRPSKVLDSPVITELQRLSTAGFKVSPTLLGDKNGYSSLTPAQNTELLQRAGQVTESKLTNLMNDPRYIQLPDDQKAKVVDDFVNKSKTLARAEKVMALTAGLTGDSLTSKLSEFKKSGLMTRDVFDTYQALR